MSVTEHWPDESGNRVVVLARLKDGVRDRAAELIAAGPPFDPGEHGFERHAVYLSTREVIFFFEGPEASRRVADIANDNATSAFFTAWAPLLDDSPGLAHEFYYWEP
jgi:hypothetical protein